jgi:hypothetical protein
MEVIHSSEAVSQKTVTFITTTARASNAATDLMYLRKLSAMTSALSTRKINTLNAINFN